MLRIERNEKTVVLRNPREENEKTVVLRNPYEENENRNQKQQIVLRDFYFVMAGRILKFGKATEVEMLIALIFLDIAHSISKKMLTYWQRRIVES